MFWPFRKKPEPATNEYWQRVANALAMGVPDGTPIIPAVLEAKRDATQIAILAELRAIRALLETDGAVLTVASDLLTPAEFRAQGTGPAKAPKV